MQEKTEIGGTEKLCERCGKQFGCGAQIEGCWCSDVAVSEKSRSLLKSRFADCLCRECLEELSSANY